MTEINRPRIGLIFTGVITLGFAIAVIFGTNYVTAQQAPVICDEMQKHNLVLSDVPIYSTEDGTAVEGSFFLGCGSIDTYLVYYYYTGDDTYGFQRQMLRGDNSVYIFRDSQIPHLITKQVWKITEMPPATACLPKNIYEIHIPKNTMIKDVIS